MVDEGVGHSSNIAYWMQCPSEVVAEVSEILQISQSRRERFVPAIMGVTLATGVTIGAWKRELRKMLHCRRVSKIGKLARIKTECLTQTASPLWVSRP
jgi:hypothetical protein